MSCPNPGYCLTTVSAAILPGDTFVDLTYPAEAVYADAQSPTIKGPSGVTVASTSDQTTAIRVNLTGTPTAYGTHTVEVTFEWDCSGLAGYIPPGASSDPDAIHDDVAGEIAAITEKATPVNADLIVIEDSADSNNKKRVQLGNLPSTGGASQLSELSDVNTSTPTSGNMLIADGVDFESRALLSTDISDSTADGRALLTSADANPFTDADETKLDGIEAGATADQTAADIRGLGFFDITNDGAGSGLDADLLDGNEASAFALSSHTHVEADITDLGDYAVNNYVPKILSTTAKTTGFTASLGETHFIDVSAGNFTASLPAVASGQGRIGFYFSATGGQLTLDPNGAEQIEGKATIKLSQGHNTIENDGTSWRLIQRSGVAPNRIDPAQITANQDGYNPADWSNDVTHLFIDSDASREIQGFEEDGFTDMQSVIVTNDGSNDIVIKHDTGTTLSSRVIVDGGADMTLGPNQSGILMRDGTANRWRFYAFLSDVSNLTAAQIRTLGFFDVTNDGAGSGLDADLLDGNEASAFALSSHTHTASQISDSTADGRAILTSADANAFTDAEQTKLAGIETGATADQTAADIRTLGFFDITNDGAASGLDADLLDGNHASAFSTTGHTHTTADITDISAAGAALIDDADATAQRTTLGLGTTDNPQFATIELGAATDTTLARSAAGVLSVEGNDVITTVGTGQQEVIGIACSDETTDLTTGTAKVTFRMPFAMTLSEVRCNVNTAPTGSVLTVDINESGATILSTKLTIDATEETSETAATAAVISDSALADDAEITIDIDTVGSTTAGKGLKVWLIGTRT